MILSLSLSIILLENCHYIIESVFKLKFKFQFEFNL